MNESMAPGTRTSAATVEDPDPSEDPSDPRTDDRAADDASSDDAKVPMVSPGVALMEVPTAAPADAVPAYVRRAQAGDTRAFGELYTLHRRDVARLAGRLLGPRGDLEDLIQEVFIQVFRSLPNFRGDSRFTTWLHRVTVNVSLMHLRAMRSRPQLGPEPVNEPSAPEGESPLDGAARNERLRALYRILDGLSDKKRAVFILHDLEGIAAAEIAKQVGSPVLTVRTRLFYARREVYAAMANDPTLDSIAKELQAAAAVEGGSTP